MAAFEFDEASAKPVGEFDPQTAKPVKTTSLQKAADVGRAFLQGAAGGAQALTDFAGAGNPASNALESARNMLASRMTPERQAQVQARQKIIKDAEATGSTLEEIKAQLGGLAEAPASTIAQGAGSIIPTAAAALLTRGRSLAAPTAIGAAQGAGAVKGTIYDDVRDAHVQAGKTPEQAQAAAEAAQAYTGPNKRDILIGAGLGAVAGSSGVETALSGAQRTAARTMLRRTVVGGAQEMVTEGAQGAQERIAGNLAQQREGFPVPTLQGAVGQGVLEGVVGGIIGGGVSAASPDQAAPAPRPIEPPKTQPPAVSPPQGVQTGGFAGDSEPDEPAFDPSTARPVVTPMPASRILGIDPAQGPLSTAAAKAVDSGATITAQQRLATQQADEEAKKGKPGEAKAEPVKPPKPVEPPPAQPVTGPLTAALAARVVPQGAPNAQAQAQQAAAGSQSGAATDARAAGGIELPPSQQAAGVPEPVPAPAADTRGSTTGAIEPVTQQESTDAIQAATPIQPAPDASGAQTPADAQADGQGAPAAAGPSTQPDVGPGQSAAPASVSAAPEGGSAESAAPVEDDRKAQLLKRISDGQRLMPTGMASIGGLANGRVNFNGDPRSSKQSRALSGAVDEAIAAGATPQEIVDAALRPPKADTVDAAAHANAAASPLNDRPQPTPAQIGAGNYPKGHVSLSGVELSIENPEGSTRRSKPNSPVKWETTMKNGHYGYVKGSVGMDGDHVDVFVKPGTPLDYSGDVYVIDQVDPKTGKPDEHKVMIGYKNGLEARQAYQGNYQKGWDGARAVTPMSWDQFKIWVHDAELTKKPAADLAASIKDAQIQSEFAADREALKGLKVGDEVEFTRKGPFTQSDGSVIQEKIERGKIARIEDKEHGRVSVGNWSVGASLLRKVSGQPVEDAGDDTGKRPLPRKGSRARQRLDRENEEAAKAIARAEIEAMPPTETDEYLASLDDDQINELAKKVGVVPHRLREITVSRLDAIPIERLRRAGGEPGYTDPVNDKPPVEYLEPQNSLLLMPCSEGKLPNGGAAKDIYQGVMWQTLRAHASNDRMPRMAILSAKHGFIGPDERIDPYEQRMTAERAAELSQQVEALSQVVGKQIGNKPVRDVMIVGGADYRHVMRQVVARLIKKGGIAADASVRETKGGIGEQRQQLGQYLDHFAPREEKPVAKPPAGARNLRNAAYDKNPLMTLLATHGLYHKKGDPKSLKTEFSPDKFILVSGYGAVFRQTGMQIDALLPYALQDGYLPPGSTEDDLTLLIERAIRGERIAPLYAEGGVEQEAERMLASRRQQEEERAQEADDAMGDLATPDIEAVDALDDDIELFPQSDPGSEAMRRDMLAMGFTEQEIEDEIARGQAAQSQAGQGDGRPAGAATEEAQADGEARTAQAPDSGAQGQGLTAPTQAEVLDQQARRERADQLDERAQIDREASGFTLQAQTVDNRQDNTGDMFGGPSPEDVLRARQKPGTEPSGPDLFSEPAKPAEPTKTLFSYLNGGRSFHLGEIVVDGKAYRVNANHKQTNRADWYLDVYNEGKVTDSIPFPALSSGGRVLTPQEAGALLVDYLKTDSDAEVSFNLAPEIGNDAQPAERFEAGRSLTKEQRKAVLKTLVDVYKAKGAPRELKGTGRDGNERYGYVHSPELFEKSDITGAMVRYHVTLPDGRIAHPTELFPDYSQSDIEAEMQRREYAERTEASEQARVEKLLSDSKATTPEQARDDFDRRNPGVAMGWNAPKDRTYLSYTKDGKFFTIMSDDVALQARAERAGWTRDGWTRAELLDQRSKAEAEQRLQEQGGGTQDDAGAGSNGREVNEPSALYRVTKRGQQAPGKDVPESIDAIASVAAAFKFAAGKTFRTNRDFKLALQSRILRAAKALKLDLWSFSAKTEDYLVRMVLADARQGLKNNANAVGWYNEKVTKALRILALIHPELATDRKARFAFTWALAVTSNGMKVDANFKLAEQAYSTYKASIKPGKEGVMPTNLQAGTAQGEMNAKMGLFNKMIRNMGFDALERLMTTKDTVANIQRLSGEEVGGENLTTVVYGAAILGPKIGNGFFANLYGHFEQLTMDRWLMRTWGRWTGTLVAESPEQVKLKRMQLRSLIEQLTPEQKRHFEEVIGAKLKVSNLDETAKIIFRRSTKKENRDLMAEVGPLELDDLVTLDEILGEAKDGVKRMSYGDEIRKIGNALTKYLDGQKEAPTIPERSKIRKTFARALDELQKDAPELTMADLQAILWYPEKRLYDSAKMEEAGDEEYDDDAAPDYANAAAKLARDKGVAPARIAKVIAAVDAELQAARRAARVQPGVRGSSPAGGVLGGQGQVTAQEPGAPYELDLFGQSIPDPARGSAASRSARSRVPGDAQPATPLSDVAPIPGDYFTRTLVGSESERELGASKILTPAHAAQATQYLYKSAVERFDAIVTDANDVPLAVVGGFKGALSQTSVYPGTIMLEAMRVPGAAKIWFSHNHPSGLSSLSRADEMLNNTMSEVFKGSGVEPMGLLAIGGNRFSFTGPFNKSVDSGAIPNTVVRKKVPVIERQLDPTSSAGITITSPSDAKKMAIDLYSSHGKPGIALLSAQHSLVAWVPTTDAMKDKLRGGALGDIYRAISHTNAGVAIIVHGGELDAGPFGIEAWENIARALRAIDVRPLDVINAKTRKSVAETGLSTIGAGPAFARGGQPFYSALEREISGVNAKAQPALGWMATINGLVKAGKVKQDEVEWSGVLDWLKMQAQPQTVWEPGFGLVEEMQNDRGEWEQVDDLSMYFRTEAEARAAITDDLRADAERHGKEEGTPARIGINAINKPNLNLGKTEVRKVTREQLVAFLGENGVKVTETVLGGAGELSKELRDHFRDELPQTAAAWIDAADRLIEAAATQQSRGANVTANRLFDLADQAYAAAENLETDSGKSAGASKYATYQLPGGTNYREVLLTLPRTITTDPLGKPARADKSESVFYADDDDIDHILRYLGDSVEIGVRKDGKYHLVLETDEWTSSDLSVLEERLGRWAVREGIDGAMSTNAFMSPHWDQANILAHIRLNDRTDSDGKRVLFVEEIQSDWAQRGKKVGFAKPAELTRTKVADIPGLKAEYSDFTKGWSFDYPAGNNSNRAVGSTKELKKSQHIATIYLRPGVTQELGPFKTAEEAKNAVMALEVFRHKDQSNLAGEFDAIYLSAADANDGANKAKVPFAPFVTKTDAWVALTLKRVIKLAADEGYDRVAFINGEQSAERYDLSKQVKAVRYTRDFETGKYEISFQPVNADRFEGAGQFDADKLPDVVGKDLAKKIVDQAEAASKRVPDADVSGRIDGLDLKVGGEGMRAFYDKIVPSVLKDVLRKVGGGALGTVRIADHASPAVQSMSATDRARFGLAPMSLQQPGFDITPAMREKAAGGLPMFDRQGDLLRTLRAAVGGQSVEQVQAIVNEVASKWAALVKVVATPDDLPIPAPADARGLHYKGTIYVVASTNRTRALVLKTLGHEAIAHYGLRGMLGREEWRKLMARINTLAKMGNGPLREIQAYVRRTYVDDDGTFNLSETQEADEIAARAVEQGIDPQTGEFRPGFGWLKAVFAKIAEFLRGLGVTVPFTNMELQGALVRAQTFLGQEGRLAESMAPAMSRAPGFFFNAEQSPLYQRRTAQSVGVISKEQADQALASDAVARRIMAKGIEVQEGDRVGARLNINVLKNTGVAVNTIHRGKTGDGVTKNRGWWGGEVIAYAPVVTLTDAYFNVDQKAREGIAMGQQAKAPMASIDGKFTKAHSFDGVEFRFNPKREHLFRDALGRVLKHADRVTISGNSAYAQGEIEYYGAEDVPPRAGDAPSQGRLLQPGDDSGTPAFARDTNVYDLTTDQAAAEAMALRARVEKAYEAGNQPLAERLDARLEALYDRIEHGNSEQEEDGLAPQMLRQQMVEFYKQEGQEGDTESDVVIDLGNRYKALTTGHEAATYPTMGEKVRILRAVLEEYAFRHGGMRDGVTDSQILDAAKDAAAWLDRRRQRRQPANADTAFARGGDQTQTPEFKAWFRDSKVVDADGRPLVSVHMTNAEFDVFSHEAQSKARSKAAGYTTQYGMGYVFPNKGFFFFVGETPPNVANRAISMPVYLSIKNPLDLRKPIPAEDASKIIDYIKAQSNLAPSPGHAGHRVRGTEIGGFRNARKSGITPEQLWNFLSTESFVSRGRVWDGLLKALGKDGLIMEANSSGTSTLEPMRGYGDGKTYTVAVALEPGQIKSAIGNRGTFDPANDDIRFARGDAAKQVVTDVLRQAGNKAVDYRSIALGALGRRQIVDLYGREIPQLRAYNQLMQAMDADKNEAGAEADSIADRWGKLKDQQKLAELMHDATLAQIDAALPFVPGDDPRAYKALSDAFAALSEEAQALYREARNAYSQHHENVRKAIRDRIMRSAMSAPRKAELMMQMDAEFFRSIKGVYFPLARFGDYVVVVRDAETGRALSVSRAETMSEAEALQAQLRRAFPDAVVGRVLKDKEFNAGRDMVGRGFMNNLYEALGRKDMDDAQRAELEDMLGQLYLSALPDLSWAKHGIHRKGMPGFSQDARRAFAQNMFHGARYLAKVRYSDLLENQLFDAQKQVEAMAGLPESETVFDSVRAQQVLDEMVKRHDAAMNPVGNPLSTALTSLGFVFHLGLSPAAAMVNLTQTALVAYPVMGAKWGFDRAAGALLTASKQAATNRNDISKVLEGDERRAYDEAVRSGVIDVTMAHDLAGIAQGEDDRVTWKLRPIMRWASFLFHHAERFNRQVTFVAAYRLARESGTQHIHAYAQAVQATYDGHFDYSATNRPRFMQGNVAKVVLLFKQYAQNMIYTLGRQAFLATKGASPAQRKQARKALGGLLAMHAAAAGVLGLPLVGTLLTVASWIGSDDDEPWDAEVAMRNALADTFGDALADAMARGLSRLTPFDISGRVGLDKLIFPDIQEGLEGQRWAESFMSGMLGPVAGIGVNAVKGMAEISEGEWARGLEAMMPTVLRGPLKALRYGQEGAIDRTGKPILEDVNDLGIIGQALGLSPSDVRLATEAKGAIHQADMRLNKRRAQLLRQFSLAAVVGDEEAMRDGREAIERFNQVNSARRITPLNMAQSIRRRRLEIEQSQGGVYLPRNRQDAFAAGQFGMDQ